MSLLASHKEVEFGVGDVIRIYQNLEEEGKLRTQLFEGIVIGIRGRGIGKSITVRKIGVQKIGIERIFPLKTPTIAKIEVVRKGVEGVNRAKLYYIRGKTKREIEEIYTRYARKKKKIFKK